MQPGLKRVVVGLLQRQGQWGMALHVRHLVFSSPVFLQEARVRRAQIFQHEQRRGNRGTGSSACAKRAQAGLLVTIRGRGEVRASHTSWVLANMQRIQERDKQHGGQQACGNGAWRPAAAKKWLSGSSRKAIYSHAKEGRKGEKAKGCSSHRPARPEGPPGPARGKVSTSRAHHVLESNPVMMAGTRNFHNRLAEEICWQGCKLESPALRKLLLSG